jgi:hypothetical protein
VVGKRIAAILSLDDTSNRKGPGERRIAVSRSPPLAHHGCGWEMIAFITTGPTVDAMMLYAPSRAARQCCRRAPYQK